MATVAEHESRITAGRPEEAVTAPPRRVALWDPSNCPYQSVRIVYICPCQPDS